VEQGHFLPTTATKPINLTLTNMTEHLMGAARAVIHNSLKSSMSRCSNCESDSLLEPISP
jgi:hypothetical protein